MKISTHKKLFCLLALFVASTAVGASYGQWEKARAADRKPGLSAYWYPQSAADCVEMAARVVIADKQGVLLREDQLTSVAADVADYTPTGGTTWAKVPDLLKVWNVHSFLASGLNVDDLARLRAGGSDVIVAVDSYDLWTAAGLGGQHHNAEGDHAVVVDKVTETSVTVVDSAWSGGRSETVSRADFVKAWADSRTGQTFAVVAW
jgi:hypothetical protein